MEILERKRSFQNSILKLAKGEDTKKTKKKRAASPAKAEPNISKATVVAPSQAELNNPNTFNFAQAELIVPKASDDAPPEAELNNPKASEFAQAELIVPKAAEDAPPEAELNEQKASDFEANLV